jgi:hypothetical protein
MKNSALNQAVQRQRRAHPLPPTSPEAPGVAKRRSPRESYVDLTVVGDYLGFTLFLVAIALIAIPIAIFGI